MLAVPDSAAWLRGCRVNLKMAKRRREAAFLGMTLSDFLHEVAGEWAESQAMRTGCVPRHWRDGRLLYWVRIPDNGWLD